MIWVSLLAGDIPAERLVRNMDFQVYMKMYCQGIKFGCPNAALLGIRASDLVHPSITLPDGTKYTYVYFISCQGEVTKKGTGQQALNKYDYTCKPDLSCAELHAKIEKSKGHAVRYGRMRAADARHFPACQNTVHTAISASHHTYTSCIRSKLSVFPFSLCLSALGQY